MCGICGIIDYIGNLNLEASVRNMAACLRHRGPDDEDARLYRGGPTHVPYVALGHRRLAIIDLSEAGRQPMESRSGLAVVLNGEIYNFREKRRECSDYPYRSRTDTEVILALYEKYGEEFVEHLNGMFALALWDGQNGKLILARDRVGKKPLYYLQTKNFFAFASEIKAFFALPEFQPALNEHAMPLYLTFGYVPTPETFYSKVYKLEPATLMVIEGEMTRTRRYWCYPTERASRKGRHRGPHDVENKLRELLTKAVESRMVADVPLGAFLSGGIDSSIIVSVMSRLSKNPVKTFSIGFEGDAAYDETLYARMAAEKFETRHTEYRVRPNALELLEKLVWHYDEPFGDSSAIPTYIVSKLTREHVTVALSGDGGDELFAGYERFAAAVWSERLPRAVFWAGKLITAPLPAPANSKSLRRRIKRFFQKALLRFPDRYLEWNSFFTRNELSEILQDPPKFDIAESYGSCLSRVSHETVLQQVLYLNFHTYLLDDLLVKTDRMSMAHGLEVRCPFLDTDLIEWVAYLPDDLKIRRGQLKYLLKRSYRNLLPAPILKRGKMGFGVPLGAWMRGELKDYSHDLLLGPSAQVASILDKQKIRQLLQEHMQEVEDHGQKIWALLCLEVWLRKYGIRPEKSAILPTS